MSSLNIQPLRADKRGSLAATALSPPLPPLIWHPHPECLQEVCLCRNMLASDSLRPFPGNPFRCPGTVGWGLCPARSVRSCLPRAPPGPSRLFRYLPTVVCQKKKRRYETPPTRHLLGQPAAKQQAVCSAVPNAWLAPRLPPLPPPCLQVHPVTRPTP